jgi:hypothetical protein
MRNKNLAIIVISLGVLVLLVLLWVGDVVAGPPPAARNLDIANPRYPGIDDGFTPSPKIILQHVPRGGVAAQADDPSPPASTVKLIFIHHSTGGNWLADPNIDQPYGGLGQALMENNYFVSATNYGWGPDSIGDRTDIPDWPEWFTGSSSSTYLNALYNEFGKNVYAPSDWRYFGDYSRMSDPDPSRENEVIMFKSCFPNSDLYGSPEDSPAPEPNDQYTVSNAKAVYNNLLAYFETRQDKLFVVITAPPMASTHRTSSRPPSAPPTPAPSTTGW